MANVRGHDVASKENYSNSGWKYQIKGLFVTAVPPCSEESCLWKGDKSKGEPLAGSPSHLFSHFWEYDSGMNGCSVSSSRTVVLNLFRNGTHFLK